MEVSFKEVKELLCSSDECEIKIGELYLIRTVTMIYTGKVVRKNKTQIVLEKAAWIADTGRWANAVKTGEFNEVEMYPSNLEVIVFKGGVSDMVIIPKLPTETK